MSELIETVNRLNGKRYSLVRHPGNRFSLKSQGFYLLKNRTRDQIISFLEEKLK